MSDSIISDTIQAAKKAHICDACGQLIAVGEQYRRVRGVWDGTVGTWKAHADCSDAIAYFHNKWELCSDEGVDLRHDMRDDAAGELAERFPAVAARLGIKERAP